jgi:C-terminal processing protease CtpA/Prc
LEIYSAQLRLDILAPAMENEKVFVVASEIENMPLQKGDEVLEANGIPIKKVLDKNEDFCFGSTKAMRRRCAVRRIVDVIGIKNAAPLALKLKQAGVVTIPRRINLTANPAAALPAEDDTGITLINATVLSSGVGYLKIDGFSGSQMRALIGKAMDRLLDTQALIIDMRENGGGDLSGNEILARLTEKDIIRYKTSFRSSDFLLSQRPSLYFYGFDPAKEFTDWLDNTVSAADVSKLYLGKPVVVLTSSRCFSACDTFVAALKANKLATVIGENTGGGTGSPLNIELPASEFAFRYSVMRGITANDEPIEGVGTKPDIYREVTKSDLLNGTDSQLIAALDFIKTKTTLPTSGESPLEVPSLSKALLNLDIPATVEDEIKMMQLMKWDEQSL